MAESTYILVTDSALPFAIGLDAEYRVTSGSPGTDGAKLLGFAQPNTEEIEVTLDDALADRETMIGLWPVFSHDDAERLFIWAEGTAEIIDAPADDDDEVTEDE
ncbi:hypothetical protein SEA_MARCIE_88 [Microbacterium phage Marcie]|nr:hypothetical protein SEA_MARCIE_88 [Microbacterium phage Marcie]